METYLQELNEVQQNAVKTINGPVMIVAGAGSGKTRVLTYRVAHLLHNGVDAFNILALTFTNKAAREMKERITKIVGGTESRNLWMGTFHSVFARILRAEAGKIGFPSNFTIYDTEDSKGLLKDIIKEFGLDDKVYKPSLVYGRISSIKNNLITAEQYDKNIAAQEEDASRKMPLLHKIYSRYVKRCFKAGAMDFDDLIMKTCFLFKDDQDVLLKYQERFRYIMVDEYQDTNFAQYVIIKQLAARYENICVVGDDSQSIYAFRGANIQNILNFEKDYPDLKTFKLEQNYRSTKNIVEAANTVIEKNESRLEKVIWTGNDSGEKIKLIQTLTDNEEGTKVANSIYETHEQHRTPYSGFAILYRTNAQSRAIEQALRKINIPYRIYGGLSFYQRKEIKDILAYFRLSINPHDEEALKRIINYPTRGIGNTTIQKLIVTANDHDVSIWTVLENVADFPLSVNSGTLNKLDDFCTLIKSFIKEASNGNAYEAGEYIANNSGILKEFYNDRTPEGVSKYENIEELLNGLKEFSVENQDKGNEEAAEAKKLSDFMQDIALLTDADKEDEKDRNVVSLMTIHAAKGLEFPYVFIVGLEENLFPSQLSLNSRSDLEEERRLFYVALTRAEKRVTLSYAHTRYRWGNLINCEPSRFIEEINEKYLDHKFEKQTSAENVYQRSVRENKESSKRVNVTNPAQNILNKNLVRANKARSSSPVDLETLKKVDVGSIVEHAKFGTGTVTKMEGVFPNNKATVQFEKAGTKQLLLKFAKLNLVS